jgi:hypothetical protein
MVFFPAAKGVELSQELGQIMTMKRIKKTSFLLSAVSLTIIAFLPMATLSGCGDDCDPRIRTDTLPDGTVGVFYKVKLDSDCSSSREFWFLADGTLPPGISLLDDGEISGTPSTAETFLFTVGLEETTFGGLTFKGLSLTIN